VHVLDVVGVRCQYSLCEMGKTTGVIDTNLGIARLPMWCSVGWCGLSSRRSGSCEGGVVVPMASRLDRRILEEVRTREPG